MFVIGALKKNTFCGYIFTLLKTDSAFKLPFAYVTLFKTLKTQLNEAREAATVAADSAAQDALAADSERARLEERLRVLTDTTSTQNVSRRIHLHFECLHLSRYNYFMSYGDHLIRLVGLDRILRSNLPLSLIKLVN